MYYSISFVFEERIFHMAWSFLILGVILMGITGIIYGVIKHYKSQTLICGFLTSFILMVMSFCFSSFKHMVACIKYDNVVVVDYMMHTSPTIHIDPSKIIYSNDYESPCHNYRYIIMAWNDEKPVSQYDKLVQKQ